MVHDTGEGHSKSADYQYDMAGFLLGASAEVNTSQQHEYKQCDPMYSKGWSSGFGPCRVTGQRTSTRRRRDESACQASTLPAITSPSNKAPQYGTYVQQHIAAEEAYKTSRTRSVRRLESGGDIACHIMRHARHIKAPSILCT